MTRSRSLALLALTLLAGCQLTPPAPVAPSLQLMESQPLVLAPGCDASGSVMVEFIVRMDGSTDELKLSPAPECVREALTAWVSSFRYLPPAADIPTGVEWLMVSARRGS
ncbi:MAG TPA: hypothetical protein VN705_23605 [Steroidobacteraceae bacterium]|jgi:hypothetical protein|nr:hypothetical protein [Steroidobacteraceae bacterium]